jgi:hypothetical protein
VDTGGSGLIVAADSIGPAAQLTGRSYRSAFVNVPAFTVDVVRAPVSVGGPDGPPVATTPGPIAVGSFPASAPTLRGESRCGPIQGILGIGLGNAGPALPPLESPLVQLPAPLSDGYTLGLNEAGGQLVLGRPSTTDRTVTVSLLRENGHYPDGRQAYQRDVVLCWTVGADRGCGPTNIDSGASTPLVRPDLLPALAARLPPVARGHAGRPVPPGTPVTIDTPGGAPLTSFTSRGTPPDDDLVLAGLFGVTQANTGMGFLLSNTVGYDLTTGQALITPR